MDAARLQGLLDNFAQTRVLVIGDFFLDKYLVLDATLTETSLETGLDAYQVVEKRLSPGAAGTVACNLRALGAEVLALGVIGEDGEGFELRAGLRARGIDTEHLLSTTARVTPTYTKPMLRENGQERELNRLDIKNRTRFPADLETDLLTRLRELMPEVDAVVIGDQVPERNCGVLTDHVRGELAELAARYPRTVCIADSRFRIGEFRHCWIKPNRAEAYLALHGYETESPISIEEAIAIGQQLVARNGRPAFLTLAEDGMLAIADAVSHIPTLRQTGPIDICGAGDSTIAGLALALCAGATPEEAAVIGNLVASITVQQIGVTGTASREQVLARFREFGEQFEPVRSCG